MKCMHVCVAKKFINSLPNYKIKPGFPSIAHEIAEPPPDMNIKVAAFTVSEKSITFRAILLFAPKKLKA